MLCRTDEEVYKRSLNECKSSSVNFVWCNFTELFSRIDEATKASVDVDAILIEIFASSRHRRGRAICQATGASTRRGLFTSGPWRIGMISNSTTR